MISLIFVKTKKGVMRNYIFLLGLFFFASCGGGESNSNKNEIADYLTSGKWKVVEFDGKEKKFSRGIVFSKDKQFFNLDSQGRIIPTQNKIVFDLSNDTLRIIDFNIEPRFLKKRGTLAFSIKEVDESSMILKSLYPDSTSTYKLKNEEL